MQNKTGLTGFLENEKDGIMKNLETWDSELGTIFGGKRLAVGGQRIYALRLTIFLSTGG